MFIIYDAIFLIFAISYLPIFIFRKKYHSGFITRFGILPKTLNLNRPIWIHAVSVGEAITIKGLVENLRKIYPNKKFVISTVTATGNKIAQTIAKNDDLVTYLPLDLSLIVKKTIDRINPALFIIAETEIWPNLISYLSRRSIPVVIVNARISDRSFGRYLAIKPLLKPILNKISLFCAQSERDAQRLIRMGLAENKVKITGNMKFDTTDYTDKKSTDYTDLKIALWLIPDGKLLVAGSTHPGEEEVILNAYKKLLVEFPKLRLLIAPRHPERALDVADIATKFGFRTTFISRLPDKCETCVMPPVFILDVIGKLMDFYALADIVFVGGSLIKKGGHNILEPAALAKPIIFGPQMFNFKDIADLFLENKACILVHDEEEMVHTILGLLNNPAEMDNLGMRAQKLISENQGATQRNLNLIKAYG